MNLIFRMIIIIFLARKKKCQKLLDQTSNTFRVWLHDLGWRNHLPNYRVYSFMELGRFDLWHGSKIALTGQYHIRMIGAQEFIYLKPMSVFKRFSMTSEIIAWDKKYFYFRHDFYCDENLVGIGLVKEACLKSGKVVEPISIIGNQYSVENIPPQRSKSLIVEQWLNTHMTIKNNPR